MSTPSPHSDADPLASRAAELKRITDRVDAIQSKPGPPSPLDVECLDESLNTLRKIRAEEEKALQRAKEELAASESKLAKTQKELDTARELKERLLNKSAVLNPPA